MSEISVAGWRMAEVRQTTQGSVLYAAVFAVVLACIANGLSIRVIGSIREKGPLDAIWSTFDISIIVWFSIYNAISLLWGAKLGSVISRDYIIVLLAVFGFAFPLPSTSWVALTILSIYFLSKKEVSGEARRAFIVTLALSFAMQWAQWISAIFLPIILNIDAVLVSLLTGYERYGNLIQARDGVMLEVLKACSSFTNISLAFLGWVSARCYFGSRGLWRGVFYLISCISIVIFINTLRIGIIAFRPDLYEIVHGEVGNFAATLILTVVIIVFSILGAKK